MLTISFARGNGDLSCHFELFADPFRSSNNIRTSGRWLFSATNVNQTIDLTDQFIAKFGQLPNILDNLLIKTIQCGIDNGQFIYPPLAKVPVIPYVPYDIGFLYNYSAIVDSRQIAASGWHVPAHSTYWGFNEFYTLMSFVGGQAIAGGKLKETGLSWWNTPNFGAVNQFGFNWKGSGRRKYQDGTFSGNKEASPLWSLGYGSYLAIRFDASNSSAAISFPALSIPLQKNEGMAIRLIKNSTSLLNGEIGSYTGNDGKIYPTICIGSQEWLSTNLLETKYRDGTPIPEVLGNSAWITLSSGARCHMP
jgi:uncharacterized protein (TIGR02145 family)